MSYFESDEYQRLKMQGAAIAHGQDREGKRSIPYYPEYNRITGSIEGSLLLQRLWYWWVQKGRKPFYKYRAPCESAKEGTTWTEELDFTAYQFDRAMAAIGTKITKGVSKAEAKATSLIIYWTDSNRMTWYEVNEELLYLLVGMAYEAPELLDHWDTPAKLELEEGGDNEQV